MATAGELVRELRLKRTMSQRELAERAGTTQAVISRIEQGRSSPTVATLERIVAAMGESLVLSATSTGDPRSRASAGRR